MQPCRARARRFCAAALEGRLILPPTAEARSAASSSRLGRGARVAISDVSVAGLDETASLLAGRGADAQRAELDVSDRLVVEEYAAVIAEHVGVVHQLYNNAGIAFSRSVLETEYADYEWLFAVNLWGVIDGTKAFLPRLVVPMTGT
jgi:NAD(P)-dependent dehydrogenase (short-subunit alcohol dehydrogenase family)